MAVQVGADTACFCVACPWPLGFQLRAQPSELRWGLTSWEGKKKSWILTVTFKNLACLTISILLFKGIFISIIHCWLLSQTQHYQEFFLSSVRGSVDGEGSMFNVSASSIPETRESPPPGGGGDLRGLLRHTGIRQSFLPRAPEEVPIPPQVCLDWNQSCLSQRTGSSLFPGINSSSLSC